MVMENLVKKTRYNSGEKFILGGQNAIELRITVKSGQGKFEMGQPLKFDTSSMQFVKYGGSGTISAVASEGADATSEAVTIMAVVKGKINAMYLRGIDYLLTEDEIATPEQLAIELLAGGSLTDATTYGYRMAFENENGITKGGTVASALTALGTSGYIQSQNAYADIAAINTILGDCSTTPKSVLFTVDGVTKGVTFDANYSGAGAFADFAAFITKCTVAGATTTVSANNKIKLLSGTTGAASIVDIVSDGTGLFGTYTKVVGSAAKQKIKVNIVKNLKATGYKVYKTADAGSTYAYRYATDAEVSQGYFEDDGTLTWTAGTLIETTDWAGLQSMFNQGIYAIEMRDGYSLNEVD